jgi:hypothetical protein
MLYFFLLLLALGAHYVAAVETVVDLGYTKYRGNQTSSGVSLWAGMRYARNPSRVDGMRFAAPQDPQPQEGIVNATKVCYNQSWIIKWWCNCQKPELTVMFYLVRRHLHRH